MPRASHRIHFAVDGPGEIVATDNGDPTSFESFQSHQREAFNGLALVIVRARKGATGRITVTASSDGLRPGVAVILKPFARQFQSRGERSMMWRGHPAEMQWETGERRLACQARSSRS